MATLYETTNQARKLIIGVLGVIVLILLFDVVSTPAPPPEIENEAARFFMFSDTLYGELPTSQIQSIETTGSPLYEIQGVHSESAFPDVSYVYQIETPRGKLGVFEERQNQIESILGFSGMSNADQAGTRFEWSKDNGTKTLSYDRVSEQWDYSTVFFQNETALSTKNISENIENYNSRTQNFITRMDFATFGLDTPIIESRYARLGANGEFVEVNRFEEADYVFSNAYRVLEQADLKLPNLQPPLEDGQVRPEETQGKVYSNDPNKGQVHLVVSNQFRDYTSDIFVLEHTEFEPVINETGEISRSAYPLISADEAWDNVTLGNGSLVALIPQNNDALDEYPRGLEITRFAADPTRTELGFWQSEEYNEGYILPIFVFRGTAQISDGRIASFTIFTDAIKRVR